MTGIGLISRRYAKALAEYSAGLGEETMVYDQLLPLSTGLFRRESRCDIRPVRRGGTMPVIAGFYQDASPASP